MYRNNNTNKIKLYLADSYSTDSTRKIAKRYVDKIILCPKGKINARDVAIRFVTEDIIISVDADNFYMKGWLENILKPSAEKSKRVSNLENNIKNNQK